MASTFLYTLPEGTDVSFKMNVLNKANFIHVGTAPDGTENFKWNSADPSMPDTYLDINVVELPATKGDPRKKIAPKPLRWNYSYRLRFAQRESIDGTELIDREADAYMSFTLPTPRIQARSDLIIVLTSLWSLLLNTSTDGVPNPEMLNALAVDAVNALTA
jgi:hypothetical protein